METGDPGDIDYRYEVYIKPGERGSFPRAAVRLTDLRDGVKSESGTLLVGTERIPITRQAATGDPNTDELVELLAGESGSVPS